MTRLIHDKASNTFGFEDRFLFWWVPRTAMDDAGNDLLCHLCGFKTIEEAMDNAQSDFHIHENCIDFLAHSSTQRVNELRLIPPTNLDSIEDFDGLISMASQETVERLSQAIEDSWQGDLLARSLNSFPR